MWPRMPRGATLSIARTATPPGLVKKAVDWEGALTLARAGKATVARASGDWLIKSIPLSLLAKHASRLELTDVSPAVAAKVVASARKLKLALPIEVVPAAPRVGYLTVDR